MISGSPAGRTSLAPDEGASLTVDVQVVFERASGLAIRRPLGPGIAVAGSWLLVRFPRHLLVLLFGVEAISMVSVLSTASRW